MSSYLGFVQLENTLNAPILTRNGNTPQDGASAPVARTYGPGSPGLMANGSVTATTKESAAITGASNATPIVITSNGHGLVTGDRVTVANVGGNTNANGDWTITFVDANNFSLNTSVGNAPYTSGGTWHTSGLYNAAIPCTSANGYVAGTTYSILWNATVGGTAVGDLLTFTVY